MPVNANTPATVKFEIDWNAGGAYDNAYSDVEMATKNEIVINEIYSFDSKENISMDFAPFVLLIPISFVLRSVINEDNPTSPRHEMMIASKEK